MGIRKEPAPVSGPEILRELCIMFLFGLAAGQALRLIR